MTAALLTPRFDVPTARLDLPSNPPLVRFVHESSLIDALSDLRGASIVTVEARTEPRLLVKHPQTGEPNRLRGNVFKVAKVNGMIGWQYASSVNRQRVREGKESDFEPHPRPWGHRISGSPFVEHEGAMYLELKVERSLGHRYETRDGQPIDAESVEPFLPKRRKSRQGIEREIVLRDYALSSITMLKVRGVTYVVARSAAASRFDHAPLRTSA